MSILLSFHFKIPYIITSFFFCTKWSDFYTFYYSFACFAFSLRPTAALQSPKKAKHLPCQACNNFQTFPEIPRGVGTTTKPQHRKKHLHFLVETRGNMHVVGCNNQEKDKVPKMNEIQSHPLIHKVRIFTYINNYIVSAISPPKLFCLIF